MSAVAIFTFLGNWTAFLWPLIVTTSQQLYTLPVGLASFAAEQETHWELIMTGASIATLVRRPVQVGRRVDVLGRAAGRLVEQLRRRPLPDQQILRGGRPDRHI